MRRLAWIAGLLALTGCVSVMPLSAPGPLASGKTAEGAMGWARLADLQDALQGQDAATQLPAYLDCAAVAQEQGDAGAAVLCLEAAYRLTFRQTGVQRWDQEEQRAKLARRLEGIKAAQGRHGAAASYAAMAALSEAYLDGGQGEDDKKAFDQAQARIAEAKAAQEKAESQATANFLGGVMNSALGAGMGTLSSEAASLNILQTEMSYLEQDSAISEAGKGLGDAEALLHKGTAREFEDRASRLLAANLASTTDPVPYARGVQAALRKSGLGGRKGPIADFLVLSPPDRARSSRRDFVQAFQAAEKALWQADLDGAPLPLAAIHGEDLGGPWNKPQNFSRMVPLLQVYTEAKYQRVIKFESTSSGKSLKVPVNMKADVDPSVGVEMSMELRPYPKGGFHFINGAAFQMTKLSFPQALTATGSSLGVTDRLGLGFYLPLLDNGMLDLAFDANTRLFAVGNSEVLWGSKGYDNFDFSLLGLELEASARLFGLLKVGVAVPVMAPMGTDVSRDAGGLRLTAGLCFAFGQEPPAKRLEAAEAGSPIPEAKQVILSAPKHPAMDKKASLAKEKAAPQKEHEAP